MTAEPEPTVAPTSRPPTTRQRYVRWWLDDLPPLDGRLRFVFYIGILLLAQHPDSKSFFLSLEAYSSTDPGVYTARGLLGAIGVSYPPTTMVQLVITATMGTCFLAAIGLFSRLSCIAIAAGAFFLHGLFLDTNAGNRAWFIPLYALIALCFTCAQDKWSVDHLIRSFFNGQSPPRSARPTACQTGFARKCLLVAVVGFYFASGLSKLFNAGLAWADSAPFIFSRPSMTGRSRSSCLRIRTYAPLCPLVRSSSKQEQSSRSCQRVCGSSFLFRGP